MNLAVITSPETLRTLPPMARIAFATASASSPAKSATSSV